MENGEIFPSASLNPANLIFFPCKIDAAGDKLQLKKEGREMERKHDPPKKIMLVFVQKANLN